MDKKLFIQARVSNFKYKPPLSIRAIINYFILLQLRSSFPLTYPYTTYCDIRVLDFLWATIPFDRYHNIWAYSEDNKGQNLNKRTPNTRGQILR